MKALFLYICILGLVVGISNLGGSEVSGLARAIGAVFFILFFITRMFKLFGEEDATTNPTSTGFYRRTMETSCSFNARLTNPTKGIL